MANIIKLYAAYKAGFLGNNILDTYFSFIANMISEKRLAVVEDTVIAAKFKESYTMDLPLPLPGYRRNFSIFAFNAASSSPSLYRFF